jgi:hypothetical protein
MRRFVMIIAFAALLIAASFAMSGPALATDVAINACGPSGQIEQGKAYTFTYVVSDPQSFIGFGVPAVVYVIQVRTHKVESQFNTTLFGGSGVLSLTPDWTCQLRPSSYTWTVWPTFPNPATTFYSICQGFTVVRPAR